MNAGVACPFGVTGAGAPAPSPARPGDEEARAMGPTLTRRHTDWSALPNRLCGLFRARSGCLSRWCWCWCGASGAVVAGAEDLDGMSHVHEAVLAAGRLGPALDRGARDLDGRAATA